MTRENKDERFMRLALEEAHKSLGRTSPNPAVGAVLVTRNRIVARGHHREAGLPHAEVDCLRNFGRTIPRGAILYITLEPCSTAGRTPACTDQLIRSGIKAVVVGAIDVNPRHSGRGIEILRSAGIEVRTGVLSTECATLNECFNKWIVTGEPFVIAKCGMSLDGRLTRPLGESHWLTSATARQDAQKLRAQVDAILVGAGTVRTDNPRLTVRGIPGAKQPLRVVLTRSKNLPRRAHLFTDQFAEKTVIYRSKSLKFVLRDLGRKKVTSILIEGGGDILGQALDQKKIDKLQIYLGPIFTGGPVIAFGGNGADRPSHAAHLAGVQYRRVGRDLCVSGYPQYREASGTE